MKLVLDQEELTNCFFEDCRLLGIMAPVKDYQFCWFRDSSFIAHSMLISGETASAAAFHRWASQTVLRFEAPARRAMHTFSNRRVLTGSREPLHRDKPPLAPAAYGLSRATSRAAAARRSPPSSKCPPSDRVRMAQVHRLLRQRQA